MPPALVNQEVTHDFIIHSDLRSFIKAQVLAAVGKYDEIGCSIE